MRDYPPVFDQYGRIFSLKNETYCNVHRIIGISYFGRVNVTFYKRITEKYSHINE